MNNDVKKRLEWVKRILNVTGSPNYEYTLTGHLGNSRVTFDSIISF